MEIYILLKYSKNKMLQAEVVEKIKTYILYSVLFFLKLVLFTR